MTLDPKALEAAAWNCDEWPEWLHDIVAKTDDVADRLDMSSQQAMAYAILSARALPTDAEAAGDPRALTALKNHQRQLDMDGVEVGVSRQALDEVVAAYEVQSALITAQAARIGELEWALEPFAKSYVAQSINGNGWTSGVGRDRICEWFGPSDFRRARALTERSEKG